MWADSNRIVGNPLFLSFLSTYINIIHVTCTNEEDWNIKYIARLIGGKNMEYKVWSILQS